MNAVPPLLGRDEARMRVVRLPCPPGAPGGGQRGAATRQGPRTTGPICPDTLAANVVPLNSRDLESLFHRVICALANAGGLAATVTGIGDATDLDPTAPYEGCGQVPRPRQMTDTRGHVHASQVTVDGWKLIVLIEARTKIP